MKKIKILENYLKKLKYLNIEITETNKQNIFNQINMKDEKAKDIFLYSLLLLNYQKDIVKLMTIFFNKQILGFDIYVLKDVFDYLKIDIHLFYNIYKEYKNIVKDDSNIDNMTIHINDTKLEEVDNSINSLYILEDFIFISQYDMENDLFFMHIYFRRNMSLRNILEKTKIYNKIFNPASTNNNYCMDNIEIAHVTIENEDDQEILNNIEKQKKYIRDFQYYINNISN